MLLLPPFFSSFGQFQWGFPVVPGMGEEGVCVGIYLIIPKAAHTQQCGLHGGPESV